MSDMGETSEETGEPLGYQLAIAGIYAFAIGVNVWIIADQLTDGALSRSVSTRLRNACDKVAGWSREHNSFRKQAAHVVFEAITIVEEGE